MSKLKALLGLLVTLWAWARGEREEGVSGGTLGFSFGTLPPDIQAIYNWCINHQGIPYVLGGGGDPSFLPSIGLTAGPTVGYDCSKLLSAAIHAGAPKEMPAPLGTHELERWGLAGEGANMTLWDVNGLVNGIPTEHCVLEFPKAPLARRFFMAHFTGGPPSSFLSSFDTTHYHPRRKVVG